MTVTMIALKPLKYAGASVAKGGKFEVRGRSDARVLQAIGHAEPVVAVVHAPVKLPNNPPSNYGVPIPVPYGTRKLTATLESFVAFEPTESPEVTPEPQEVIESEAVETTDVQPKPKRQYRRRDMTAEGGEG